MFARPTISSAIVILLASGTSRGGEVAPPVSFRLDVAPTLTKLGCNQGACHGSQKGKGGFKLSLRGEDPANDLAAIARDALGRRVDRDAPASSLLVLKPSGRLPHEGGKLLDNDSAAYQALVAWISQGCADDHPQAPRVVGLEVRPAEKALAGGPRRQQLSVFAKLSDGMSRDVTRWAVYEASEPSRVGVTAAGLVEASEPLEVAVAVRFAGARTVSRLAFLANRPDFVWRPAPVFVPFDRLVHEKLQAVRVQPSEIADDAMYLRRAFLAAIGRLPTVAESRRFLADGAADKRAKLARALVDRSEFAEFWALKWADVLRNEEKVMGPKGVELFQRWLVEKMRLDAPAPELARALLATVGSTWEHPGASFHRTNREPAAAAEAAAQVFLGYRLQCAKCHNHPFDVWTQDDYYGLAAYFARVERKRVGPDQRRDKNDKHENNGDEVIALKAKADFRHPIRNVRWSPKPLGRPAGDRSQLRERPLESLADGIVADPQFSRNLANRIWYHLFGRGIVDPPDDFRESNPPSNPALLTALTQQFVADGQRLKPLVVAILSSRTFQSSSASNDSNRSDEINFARYPAHLLPAEALFDAIAQVLEAKPAAAQGKRAVQLAGVKTDGRFLKVFGKPDRLLTCECERFAATSLAQAFQMINGPDVRTMLAAPNNRLGRLLAARTPAVAIVEELYLAALCRPPTPSETGAMVGYLAKATDPRIALEDIAWSLLNSKEFLLLQ